MCRNSRRLGAVTCRFGNHWKSSRSLSYECVLAQSSIFSEGFLLLVMWSQASRQPQNGTSWKVALSAAVFKSRNDLGVPKVLRKIMKIGTFTFLWQVVQIYLPTKLVLYERKLQNGYQREPYWEIVAFQHQLITGVTHFVTIIIIIFIIVIAAIIAVTTVVIVLIIVVIVVNSHPQCN